jgi:hypothetical protein
MDDTSLDDFLASESEGEGDTENSAPDESAGEHAQSPADSPDTDGVAPATTTFRWVGDGAACAVCESTAQRLWKSPDGLVCATCKEW